MKLHRKNTLKRRTKRKYSKHRFSHSIRIFLLISAVLFASAAFLFTRYVIGTKSAKKLQQEMKDTYTAAATLDIESVPAAQDIIQIKADVPSSSAVLSQISSSTVSSPAPVIAAQFLSLYSKNSDLVGWLKADAVSAIDFAVVQRDDSYYLDHDFYGRVQQSGTVYLDESSSILPRSTNFILHGHNMKNGTMFGKLHKYLDPVFVASNPQFEFSTLYDSAVYVPYAISIVLIDPQSSRYAFLVQSDFSSDADMMMYVDNLRALSVMELSLDIVPEDKLLTLITCHGHEESERLVIALRQLRPDESIEPIK